MGAAHEKEIFSLVTRQQQECVGRKAELERKYQVGVCVYGKTCDCVCVGRRVTVCVCVSICFISLSLRIFTSVFLNMYDCDL